MTTHKVVMLPGDGIGPEIMDATLDVIDATGVNIEWVMQLIGEEAEREWGNGLPESTLEAIRQIRVALKSPTNTPQGGGHRSYNVTLREKLVLSANIRPYRKLPNVGKRFADHDSNFVIFRENLEDLYVGREYKTPRGAEAISEFTYEETERFARIMFEYMRKHGRKKLTIPVKDNILKETHGVVFRQTIEKVAGEYPEIKVENLIADAFGFFLVMNPSWFDVIALPNFLGDFVSDQAAAIVYESIGFAAGGNIGTKHAVFEAVGGTAPDIAGKGVANPSALILSGCLMLDHLGELAAAERVRKALQQALRDGIYTADVNRVGAVGTKAFTQAVIDRLH